MLKRQRQHDKDKHGGKRAEEATDENLCQQLVNKLAENQITNTSIMSKSIEEITKIVVGMSKKEDETIPILDCRLMVEPCGTTDPSSCDEVSVDVDEVLHILSITIKQVDQSVFIKLTTLVNDRLVHLFHCY